MRHPPLVETHTPGPGTHERILRAAGCPSLVPYQIAHVGLAEAVEPYTMVRTDLPGSYFLACFRGEGRIWLDGRWQRCRAGQACLSPAHVLCAFHAVPGHRWDFVWVRYEASAGRGPLGAAGAPVLAGFPSEAVFPHNLFSQGILLYSMMGRLFLRAAAQHRSTRAPNLPTVGRIPWRRARLADSGRPGSGPRRTD